jgi:hypothetical protein
VRRTWATHKEVVDILKWNQYTWGLHLNNLSHKWMCIYEWTEFWQPTISNIHDTCKVMILTRSYKMDLHLCKSYFNQLQKIHAYVVMILTQKPRFLGSWLKEHEQLMNFSLHMFIATCMIANYSCKLTIFF